MNTIAVGLADRGYPIHIGEHCLPLLGEKLRPLVPGAETVAVITDETVWALHGKAFGASLEQAGLDFRAIVLPPGEESKSLGALGRVYGALADMGLRRDGLVAAFGGGVAGDLAGFAAATYMRGVSLVQVPTTLLAQVDSSVGGKTAINLPQGKNLAGAFYQPRLVLADTGLLSTLPSRELASGMAEVVKYGAIWSRPLFDALDRDEPDLVETVATCCKIKAEVVEGDERDTGRRMILNFGHTFGHAVEALGGFKAYTHGEAVAVGMVMAAEVGEELGLTAPGTAERLRALLRRHRLPTTCPYAPAELLDIMALDKKAESAGIRLILLREIGDTIIETVAPRALRETMERTAVKWRQQG